MKIKTEFEEIKKAVDKLDLDNIEVETCSCHCHTAQHRHERVCYFSCNCA